MYICFKDLFSEPVLLPPSFCITVDLTGKVNMIEKLVMGGTGTRDLMILSLVSVTELQLDKK